MFTAIQKYLGWGAALVFVACLSAIYILKLQNDVLTADKNTISLARDQFKQHATDLYHANAHHIKVIERNKQRYASLLGKLETGQRHQINYQAKIKQLEQQNETLKIWSDTPIPLDVKQLFRHQALNRTEDYEQWLSERFTLHPARERPPDQRRSD